MRHSYRLRGKKLEGPLVAPGWLAVSTLLLCVWGYRLPVAAIGQQQQMSYSRPLLSPSSGPDFQPAIFHIVDVRRAGSR